MFSWGDVEINKKLNICAKHLVRLKDRVILHNGMSDLKTCVECAMVGDLGVLKFWSSTIIVISMFIKY
jgi:hypothetical protein